MSLNDMRKAKKCVVGTCKMTLDIGVLFIRHLVKPGWTYNNQLKLNLTFEDGSAVRAPEPPPPY